MLISLIVVGKSEQAPQTSVFLTLRTMLQNAKRVNHTRKLNWGESSARGIKHESRKGT